ncbi:MAG: DUF4276 family protein [Planctomycetota bacterium]|nr:DUF4276 family protein [Planctomycetota bacterium]
MKFVLLVEGDTERRCLQKFIKRWLDPRLQSPVKIQPVQLKGWGRFRKDAVIKSRLYLAQPKGEGVIGVIALLDLHGPTFFPENLKSSAERYDWGTKWFEKEIASDRFRMFFAVHELEAWLLSDLAIFPVKARSAFPASTAQPETVNSQTPPSLLIKQIYRERLQQDYKKTATGVSLFESLDPELAAKRCPRLNEMFEVMLDMAQAAGC